VEINKEYKIIQTALDELKNKIAVDNNNISFVKIIRARQK
jgi:hypothetical protein